MIYFEQLFSELQKHTSGNWQAYYIIIYAQKIKVCQIKRVILYYIQLFKYTYLKGIEQSRHKIK